MKHYNKDVKLVGKSVKGTKKNIPSKHILKLVKILNKKKKICKKF